MTATNEKLSILIPVYNERYTVSALIDQVLQAKLPDGMARELVIVNDCSTDGTHEVLESLAQQHPRQIRLYHHSKNQGKGSAVQTAIQHATGTICLVQDADLEYDPADYPTVLQPILEGEADVVYGSRFLSSSRRRVLYFWHSIGNRFLTLLSNMFTNLNLTDMETCYKAVRTHILKSIPLRAKRFGIEPELTAKLAKRGCRIYEVPISYRGRTYLEGKKITWWDGIKAIAVIVYYRFVDDIYEEQYGHAILHSLSGAHRFNHWMADQIRPWVGDEVLEIGAGLGNLSAQLLPRDRYVASDIDEMHLEYLRNRFGVRPHVNVKHVSVDHAEDFEGEGMAGSFDTVVCLNVLEHIEDDQTSLENMVRALRPGGAAIVLVPQGQWLHGVTDEVLGHFRRYSRDELDAKCRRAGLHVEQLFSFNRISVFPWWFSGKVMKRKEFGKVQLKLFDGLVWLWRRIDRFLPWPGLSVIVVARKPSGGEGEDSGQTRTAVDAASESSSASQDELAALGR
jgi:glycosyltransferase involved in cell wall biosynthesis